MLHNDLRLEEENKAHTTQICLLSSGTVAVAFQENCLHSCSCAVGIYPSYLTLIAAVGIVLPHFLHGGVKTMDPCQPCCAKSHHLSSVHHIPVTIEDFEVAIVPRKADGMRGAPYHIQSRHKKKCPAWKKNRSTGDKRHWALLESGEGFPKKNVEQAKYASTWCLKTFQFQFPTCGVFCLVQSAAALDAEQLGPLKGLTGTKYYVWHKRA